MINPKEMAKAYKYTVSDISEGTEVGFEAIIPKFPKLYVLADSPGELHNVVYQAIVEEITYRNKKNLPIPKPDISNYSGRFILRIRPEVHEQLSQLSKAEGSTLNQYVTTLIESQIC